MSAFRFIKSPNLWNDQPEIASQRKVTSSSPPAYASPGCGPSQNPDTQPQAGVARVTLFSRAKPSLHSIAAGLPHVCMNANRPAWQMKKCKR